MTTIEDVLLKMIQDLLFAVRAAHAQLNACEKAIPVVLEKYVKPEDCKDAKEFLDESLVSLRQASFFHDWAHETYPQLLEKYAQMIPDETTTGKEVQAALEGLDSVTSHSVHQWLASLDSTA
jgi:threonine synthase